MPQWVRLSEWLGLIAAECFTFGVEASERVYEHFVIWGDANIAFFSFSVDIGKMFRDETRIRNDHWHFFRNLHAKMWQRLD